VRHSLSSVLAAAIAAVLAGAQSFTARPWPLSGSSPHDPNGRYALMPMP